MKSKLLLGFLPILIASVSPICANGHTLQTDGAGRVEKLLGDNAATIEYLSVNGEIDARDLFFMAEQMPALTNLDLTNAKIESYAGAELRGRRSYAAAEIPAMTFAGSALQHFTFPGLQTVKVDDGAFASSALVNITIPRNVTLGTGVFAGSPNLTSVMVRTPEVAPFSFTDCTALDNVSIGTLTKIGESAFESCSALTKVIGSQAISDIAPRAFEGCAALSEFTFGNALTTIGTEAFAGSGLANANLTDCTALKAIDDRAFAQCVSLADCKFGQKALTLGNGVFFGDSALTNILIPGAVLADGKIPAFTFKGNTSLDLGEALPAEYTSVGAYALMGLSQVETYTVPATLEYIGNNAMEGWTGLQDIESYNATVVPTLGTDVWAGIDPSKVNLHVPAEMQTAYRAMPQWQDFNIIGHTGIEDITPDGATESGISAWFAGMTLNVASRGADIDNVRLYDFAGIELASLSPYATEATIDTSDLTARMYIVQVTTADGAVESFKLIRR